VASASSSSPPTRITQVELLPFRQHSLMTAVRQLRPRLLAPSKPSMAGPNGEPPVVYLDGVYQGGPESLEVIPAYRVSELRRLSETEAYGWFVRRHPGGVLVVTSRR
jgi:hypothetical protein